MRHLFGVPLASASLSPVPADGDEEMPLPAGGETRLGSPVTSPEALGDDETPHFSSLRHLVITENPCRLAVSAAAERKITLLDAASDEFDHGYPCRLAVFAVHPCPLAVTRKCPCPLRARYDRGVWRPACRECRQAHRRISGAFSLTAAFGNYSKPLPAGGVLAFWRRASSLSE